MTNYNNRAETKHSEEITFHWTYKDQNNLTGKSIEVFVYDIVIRTHNGFNNSFQCWIFVMNKLVHMHYAERLGKM